MTIFIHTKETDRQKVRQAINLSYTNVKTYQTEALKCP